MHAAVEHLARHGASLLGGVTLLLGLGSAGGLLMRAPIHRQRIGELTVLGVLVWLVFACVPMRRWKLEEVGHWIVPGRGPAQQGAGTGEARESPARSFATEDRGLHESDGGDGGDSWTALASLIDAFEADETNRPSEVEADLPEGPASALAPPLLAPVGVAASAPAPAIPWSRYGAMAYLLGAAVWSAWLLLGRVVLFRVVRAGAAAPGWLQRLCEAVQPAARRRPRLVVSSRCRQAFSFGILRPTVVVPAKACGQDRSDGLRHVVLHELGHVAQRDAWGNLVLNVALPVLYVHPLYWWLRRQVRGARELIADDWAAGHSTKEAYAEDLLALVKAGGRCRLSYLGVLGVSALTSHFYRRMDMLLRREEPLATRCSGAWRWLLLPACAAVVAVMVMAVGAERTTAQEVKSEGEVEQAERVERDADAKAAPSADDKDLKEEIARLQKQRDVLLKQMEDLRARMEELKDKANAGKQAEALLKSVQEQTARAQQEADLARKQAAIAAKRSQAGRKEGDETKGPRSKGELEFYKSLAGREELSEEELGAIASGLGKAPVNEEEKAKLLSQVYRALVEAQRAKAERAAAEARAKQEAAAQAEKLAAARAQEEAATRAQKFGEELARKNAEVAARDARVAAQYQRAFEAQTQVGALLGRRRSGPQSDLDALINLATQYVNAQSEVRSAEPRLSRMQTANERVPTTFPQTDVDVVAIELEAAKRKLELFHKIAEALLEATEAEIQAAHDSMQDREISGFELRAARSQMAQAEAKRKILKLILSPR